MAMMTVISIKSIYLLLLVGFVGAQDGIFDIVAKYGAKPDGEISQVKTKIVHIINMQMKYIYLILKLFPNP